MAIFALDGQHRIMGIKGIQDLAGSQLKYKNKNGSEKKGGLINKLQNGGLGIQSYDDNLKKGGLAKKARKKYLSNNKVILYNYYNNF